MRAAWKDLRLNPLRSSLTALSLFVGILSIVVIVAGGAVARDYLLAVAEQRDGRAPTEAISVGVEPTTDPSGVARFIDHLPQSSARAVSARVDLASPLDVAPIPSPGSRCHAAACRPCWSRATCRVSGVFLWCRGAGCQRTT
ncbi:hypothetical protein [Clavibacter nebraskensis]|uniref:hypothetical protein n=1 Tax=Clavibacter nebraskensis TaxID=31963 RepID=UPI003DA16F27